MPDDLDGRAVIVTGAARSIGRAIADTLAAAGASVVGIDRSFGDADPPGWQRIEADVTDRSAIADAVARTVAAHGRIDALVNNAGISRRSSIDDLTEHAWREVHDVNLLAGVSLIHDVLPHLTAGASIVNVSSIRARRGFAGDAAYIASKGGVDALTRALAVELGPRGIRVNSVAPGAIETEMNTAALADPAHHDFVLSRIPLGRVGLPDDIAQAVRFLVGGSSSFVTGSVLTVDGGQTALG